MTRPVTTMLLRFSLSFSLVMPALMTEASAQDNPKGRGAIREQIQQQQQQRQQQAQQNQPQSQPPQRQPRVEQPPQQPRQPVNPPNLGGNRGSGQNPVINRNQGGGNQTTRKIEIPRGNAGNPVIPNTNRQNRGSNAGGGIGQNLNQNAGAQPVPRRRDNNPGGTTNKSNVGGNTPTIGGNRPNLGGNRPNVGDNKPNIGGNRPNLGGNNPNLGGNTNPNPGRQPILNRRDNDNKPGGIVNKPNLGNPNTGNPNVGNPNLGNTPGRGLPNVTNRSLDLKKNLKQIPPVTGKREANERQLIRNRDQVNELISKNPKLKERIQTPDGKLDLSKLHLEHGAKDRISAGIQKNGGLPRRLDRDSDLAKRLQPRGNPKNLGDLDDRLKNFRDPDVLKRHPELGRIDFKHASGHFQNQLDRHQFDRLADSKIGKQLNLQQQFNLHQRGDVARQMNLNAALVNHGGWKHRYMGPIYAGYTASSFSSWYCGPGWYPSYCWTPQWSPWVDWCWWDTCPIIYDPRPIYCRPIYYYDPCPVWVVYDYPVWQPLPVVACGTWVDLPTPVLVDNTDVQLVAVRFVDNGHTDQDLGTRYRVWFENHSKDPITSPFNVMLLASNTPDAAADLPQAGVTIESMEPGEMQVVDIRLPLAANRMNRVDNHSTPFNFLHVLVDSHRQLEDRDLTNNGAVVPRTDILPVDPAAFAPDVSVAAPGAVVSIAGEGFGPEPGQLIITVNGEQTEATVYGWYDLGVQFELPNLAINQPTDAEVLVVRGDGAASNPVTVRIAPEGNLEAAALPAAPAP